jgi:hypothetical protein
MREGFIHRMISLLFIVVFNEKKEKKTRKKQRVWRGLRRISVPTTADKKPQQNWATPHALLNPLRLRDQSSVSSSSL